MLDPVTVTIVLSLMPGVWLAIALFANQLGFNPVDHLIRELGTWTLRLLLLGLCITPLAQVSGWPKLVRLRRPLGLIAFAYGLAHLVIYLWLDLDMSVSRLVQDIGKRPFILVGALALLLLLPLAATSFNAAIRTIGGQTWRLLHRLVYLICALGALHFFMLVKADKREVLIYVAILAVLLILRVPLVARQLAIWGRDRRQARRASSA